MTVFQIFALYTFPSVPSAIFFEWSQVFHLLNILPKLLSLIHGYAHLVCLPPMTINRLPSSSLPEAILSTCVPDPIRPSFNHRASSIGSLLMHQFLPSTEAFLSLSVLSSLITQSCFFSHSFELITIRPCSYYSTETPIRSWMISTLSNSMVNSSFPQSVHSMESQVTPSILSL